MSSLLNFIGLGIWHDFFFFRGNGEGKGGKKEKKRGTGEKIRKSETEALLLPFAVKEGREGSSVILTIY